jgi:putative NADH-flavin reductase
VKLVVLGASGGVGRLLARGALDRGHAVTAVVRPSSDLDLPPAVDVLRGALDDAAFLTAALQGADAVLSGLGLRVAGLAPWHRPDDPTFLDRHGAALLEAMRRAGVERLAWVSAGGAGDSYAKTPAAFRAFIAMTSLRNVYPALSRLEAALLASGLDVCIARPGGLTDAPPQGGVRVVERMAGPQQISRGDVAAWMLDQLAHAPFPHRAALISTAAT